MLEQGKSVSSPPPEEEGAPKTICDEMTSTPIPRPPYTTREEAIEKIGHEVEPGEGGRGREKVFLRFGFVSHYPTLI